MLEVLQKPRWEQQARLQALQRRGGAAPAAEPSAFVPASSHRSAGRPTPTVVFTRLRVRLPCNSDPNIRLVPTAYIGVQVTALSNGSLRLSSGSL